MAQDFFEHLSERGLVQDHTPDFQEHTSKAVRTAYIGFDPTAASLHIGNLATLNLLVRWMQAGHRGIVLMGGATGMIGDPSGKSAERNLLDEETIRRNVAAQKIQIERYMQSVGTSQALVVNNLDWFSQFSFLDFLREYGKTITVGYMMAKDSVKNRLETGLSFTEFSYQLLQAVDFLYLFKNHGTTVQMGGSDQWGNITTGIEYIRRQAGSDSHALTTPLVTKADGTKFGKSESGNVWLDAELTTPFQMYQFWLNVGDDEVERLLKVFTFLPIDDVNSILEEHRQNPNERAAQKKLAYEVTRLLHGEAAVKQALLTSKLLFGNSKFEDWKGITEEELLGVLEGVPRYSIGGEFKDQDVISLVSVGTDSKLFPSKGEARKLIKQGGLSINLNKVTETDVVSSFEPLHGKYLLGTKGKKNFFLLEIA